MACSCKKERKAEPIKMSIKNNEISATSEEPLKVSSSARLTAYKKSINASEAVEEASSIDLEQCYLCTLKHISRAQVFFEEYHTGYTDRAKRLIQSLRIGEGSIKQAFLLWCRIQAQLDMASGELLGDSKQARSIDKQHIEVANRIREERLLFQDDPLYVPNFDELLIAVQALMYSE